MGENLFTRAVSLLVLTGLSVMLMSSGWRTDFDRAKMDAKRAHKLILLKFSGSDWCVPCIKMEDKVFSSESFTHFAAANLEMVCADFPRMKKHKLEASLREQNETLAEQYNKSGSFPYTVLLDADGRVLKTWDGYNGEKPETLIQQIKSYAGTY
jgi:thioredoxin-related protein